MKLTPPLKWPGGKSYLAKRIVSMMPRHLHYVEPYAGGLAVLLNRDPNDESLWLSNKTGQKGVSEVVNDLNGDLTNFWRVLRSSSTFSQFVRRCEATALSRPDWESAGKMIDLGKNAYTDVGRAWAFFVRCRQSRAGGFKSFTSMTRSRTRRGINGNASEWLGAVEGLLAVHTRLRPVVVENTFATKIISREDGPATFFYLDPPYLHATRTSKDLYQYEMTKEQHQELLYVLDDIKGKFILSGYHSNLYDNHAKREGWNLTEVELPNHNAGGSKKRRMTECLWSNY